MAGRPATETAGKQETEIFRVVDRTNDDIGEWRQRLKFVLAGKEGSSARH